VQDISDGVKRIVVAIGPGKNYDSEFHCVLAPYGIRGTPILAHAGVGRLPEQIVQDRAETSGRVLISIPKASRNPR
jgi:hypothetical protein